jgi:hypothetical protein
VPFFYFLFFPFVASECDKTPWNLWNFIDDSADDGDDDRTEINPAKHAKTNKQK